MSREAGIPPAAARPAGAFVRELGLFDATMVVAGSMIGSGIFIVSADIARETAAPFWLLMAWALTGALTLMAALASGELAALYPHAGGQYVYLREAFGPLMGFLYGWTLLAVIQAGTIAAVGVAFAKFLGVFVPWVSGENRLIPLVLNPAAGKEAWDFSLTTQRVVGILVIALLTFVNTRGVKTAKWIQNIFTITKLSALGLLCLIPFLGRSDARAIETNFRTGRFFGEAPFDWGVLAIFGATLIGPLFSSDAWNNVAFAGEEVKEPHRTLPRSMAMGVLLVSSLYCLANVAYLLVLPLWGSPDGVGPLQRGIQYAAGDRVGTAAVQVLFGEGGALLMAALVMISTFGCENGLILAGPRLYYAMSRDGLFFQAAGRLNRYGVPAWGLVLQGVWAALLTLSGRYGDLLNFIIFAALLFYVLTVGAVFVLRRRHPELPRRYKTPGYPYLPGLYIVVAGAIMLNLLVQKPKYSWPGLIIVAIGVLIYKIREWIARRRRAAGASDLT